MNADLDIILCESWKLETGSDQVPLVVFVQIQSTKANDKKKGCEKCFSYFILFA